MILVTATSHTNMERHKSKPDRWRVFELCLWTHEIFKGLPYFEQVRSLSDLTGQMTQPFVSAIMGGHRFLFLHHFMDLLV